MEPNICMIIPNPSNIPKQKAQSCSRSFSEVSSFSNTGFLHSSQYTPHLFVSVFNFLSGLGDIVSKKSKNCKVKK